MRSMKNHFTLDARSVRMSSSVQCHSEFPLKYRWDKESVVLVNPHSGPLRIERFGTIISWSPN